MPLGRGAGILAYLTPLGVVPVTLNAARSRGLTPAFSTPAPTSDAESPGQQRQSDGVRLIAAANKPAGYPTP